MRAIIAPQFDRYRHGMGKNQGPDPNKSAQSKTVQGGCHCGAVRFTASLPTDSIVLHCNCSICSMTGFVHLLAHNNSRAFQVNHKMVRLVKVKDNATMMVSADEICMTALNPKSVTIQPISSVKVSFTEAGSLKAAIAGSAPATQTSTVTSSSQQHAQIRPVALLKETERLTQSQTAEFPIKTENCDVIMLDD